jgi:hypothetical protein
MTDLLLPALDGLGTPPLAPAHTRHTPYLDFDVSYAVVTYRRLDAALPFNGFAPLTSVVRA